MNRPLFEVIAKEDSTRYVLVSGHLYPVLWVEMGDMNDVNWAWFLIVLENGEIVRVPSKYFIAQFDKYGVVR